MRVTRAFVASFGAGLSLVAASVTVLFALSAVVAVRGWPGMDPDDDVSAVVLAEARLASGETTSAPAGADGEVAAVAASVPAAIVLPAAAPERPSRGTRSGTAQRTGAPSEGSGPQSGGGDDGRGAEPGAQPGTGSAPAGGEPGTGGAGQQPQPGGASQQPAPGGAAPGAGTPGRPRPVTSGVSDTVRNVGTTAGGVVDRVAPGTGQAVRDTTSSVADTVDQTGQAVTDVTGRVPGVVENTGQAVEKVTKGDVPGALDEVGDLVNGLLGQPRP